jgi:hypothetical protein
VIGETIEAGSGSAASVKGSIACGLFTSNRSRPNIRLRLNAFSRSSGNCIRFRRIEKLRPSILLPVPNSQWTIARIGLSINLCQHRYLKGFRKPSYLAATFLRYFHDLSVPAALAHMVLPLVSFTGLRLVRSVGELLAL